MPQKQIFRNDAKLGFLPWSSGYRLGAARWTYLAEVDLLGLENQIQVVNTAGHQIPEIPNLFRNGATYDLPRRTLGAHFTPPQLILWHIDSIDSDSYLEDFQLFALGSEGSSFKLSAEVESVIIGTYECQIEEKEKVQLHPFTVSVRPFIGHMDIGMCQLICNTNQWFPQHYEADLQKVELRIGERRYAAENQRLTTGNKMMYFGSLFSLHLSKCLQEGGSSAEVKWFTGHQVFTAEVTLDYTELNLESISSSGYFDPDRIHLAELYTDDKSESISTLDLLLGETTLHGWPISLQITTPTATSLVEINERVMSIPIKREKFQEWFGSPSENENHRSVTLTPYVAGQVLLDLTSTVHIYLDMPERPSLGLQGELNVDWREFLRRSEGEYHTIQKQIGLNKLFKDEEWFDEISPEKHFALNRNSIYRMISKPLEVAPEIICEKTRHLLEEHCTYNATSIKVEFRPGKVLSEHYGGDKSIDVESSEVQILYPRQKFVLYFNGVKIGSNTIVAGESLSLNPDTSLPVFQSYGTSYSAVDSGENIDYQRMNEVFAYRPSNQTFAAPQEPGVYYLHLPLNGEHYLVELEVHGFMIPEVIE